MDISKTLRNEIKKSGKTRYRISKESGIKQEQLLRLMKGKTLTVKSCEVLLVYFGYELSKKGGRK
jgi:hypothetical protein